MVSTLISTDIINPYYDVLLTSWQAKQSIRPNNMVNNHILSPIITFLCLHYIDYMSDFSQSILKTSTDLNNTINNNSMVKIIALTISIPIFLKHILSVADAWSFVWQLNWKSPILTLYIIYSFNQSCPLSPYWWKWIHKRHVRDGSLTTYPLHLSLK